jgi:hypothetical protein
MRLSDGGAGGASAAPKRAPGPLSAASGCWLLLDRGIQWRNPQMMVWSTSARSSGVQLHPTSLPGGRLGDEAYRFVDWLAAAGQTWWQMLPLGPPGEGGSPYKSPSAFAASGELLADPHAPVAEGELAAFRERESYWIEDWERFAGEGAAEEQLRFDREWGALRGYAGKRGVRLIGDMPIYVAPGGADHRTHPELFLNGVVAGAPPDKFTDLGQLWGNPLYDWPALRRRDYRWWVERFRRASCSIPAASTTSGPLSPTGPCPRGRRMLAAGTGAEGRGERPSMPPADAWASCP